MKDIRDTKELRPTITAVITSYNSSATLSEAIESVISQTYQPTEILVVDDGSTDNSAEVAASYGERVKVISQSNSGPSSARNTGIAQSKGEWIAFLDGDDVWNNEKLQRQIQIASEHPELDLIATSWSRSLPYSPYKSGKITRVNYSSLLLLNRFQTSTVLVKKSSIERIGGFETKLDTVEDWACWLKLSRSHQICILEETLVMYRDNASGVSKNLLEFYNKTLLLLEQESQANLVNDQLFNTIVAWHYLRISVGMILTKNYGSAGKVAKDLLLSKYRAFTLKAFSKYLAPFLISRIKRRTVSAKS